LQDVSDSDMVGITIQNQVNQNDKIRRKDQLSGEVVWSVFDRVSQSFNALDILVVTAFGQVACRVWPMYQEHGQTSVCHGSSQVKYREVKAEENFLAHALIITIAREDNDVNYTSYSKGRKIRPVVQTLLQEIGMDLTNGVGIPEINRFQEHFQDYQITVNQGLSCDDIMFEGRHFQTYQLTLR